MTFWNVCTLPPLRLQAVWFLLAFIFFIAILLTTFVMRHVPLDEFSILSIYQSRLAIINDRYQLARFRMA